MTRPQHYSAWHAAVRRARGPASAQTCVDCGHPACDWARRHEAIGDKPDDYQPMCHKCHMVYDKSGVRQSAEVVARRVIGIVNAVRSDNRSGVPGIHRHKLSGKWRVQIRKVDGGLYDDLADAVMARNKLARKLYGPAVRVYPAPKKERM
jgi:hypothetical protein